MDDYSYNNYEYASRRKSYADQNAYVSTDISHLHSVNDLRAAFDKLSPEGGTVYLKIKSIPGAEVAEQDALDLAYKAVDLADKAGNVRVVLRVREKGYARLCELGTGFEPRFTPVTEQTRAQGACGVVGR